jgi:succinate dehydrogenase / fumarate reductase membrane anchor subunit
MNRPFFRSPQGRAVGLASAKAGSQHWLAQRVTAVALVPLTLWFVAPIIAHAGATTQSSSPG